MRHKQELVLTTKEFGRPFIPIALETPKALPPFRLTSCAPPLGGGAGVLTGTDCCPSSLPNGCLPVSWQKQQPRMASRVNNPTVAPATIAAITAGVSRSKLNKMRDFRLNTHHASVTTF